MLAHEFLRACLPWACRIEFALTVAALVVFFAMGFLVDDYYFIGVLAAIALACVFLAVFFCLQAYVMRWRRKLEADVAGEGEKTESAPPPPHACSCIC